GIPTEEQLYLFQKFKTLSSKSTGGEGSTGLGLSIVKSLVETLGGSVECMSHKSEGAIFTLKIPLIITKKNRKNEVISTLG
ncbi:MAG: HAMP domain-containing histidine kinase, partial [Cyclobacteriaceae bacterium]|nr:HAMP domain-containing histidine kinase [Cyclobacteriaceae bacterium]